MIYLLLGAAALAVLVWLGRTKSAGKRRSGARQAAGVFSIIAMIVAALLSARGIWIPGAILFAMGLASAFGTRSPKVGEGRPMQPPAQSGMNAEEARSMLGVGPDATREEIQAAYTRLMRLAHPDKGGTSGLAAQLNAARDRLLGR